MQQAGDRAASGGHLMASRLLANMGAVCPVRPGVAEFQQCQFSKDWLPA